MTVENVFLYITEFGEGTCRKKFAFLYSILYPYKIILHLSLRDSISFSLFLFVTSQGTQGSKEKSPDTRNKDGWIAGAPVTV